MRGKLRFVAGHFPRAHHPSPALLDHPDILFRFDIVEIVVDDTGPTFNLIKDAFKLPESYIYQGESSTLAHARYRHQKRSHFPVWANPHPTQHCIIIRWHPQATRVG